MDKNYTFLIAAMASLACAIGSVFLSANTISPNEWATDSAMVSEIDADKRLKELGIELPSPTKSLAIYKKAVVVDKTIYLSGHIPVDAAGNIMKGKVGENVSVEQGAMAAKRCAIALLATLKNKVSSLNKVKRLVKTTGMVNCTSDFTQQPEVINGCSQLIVDIFGEDNGKGTRAAVGMSSLPRGAICEIEMIFELK